MSKIYTIRFHNTNEIYIGSTIQPLVRRLGNHKKNENSPVYKLIYDKYDGNWSNCYIELYENCECNSKEELDKRESELIRLFKNDGNYECINNRFITSNDEIERKKKKNEYGLIYREVHKDKLNERFNCKCGGRYTFQNQSIHFKSKLHQAFITT